ncbi:uncharacterized protein [Anas platyrhynchos]|uniref:uncharacterized protein n=1 Tax=Anas platyrhynchos TaxID=8839 RepID=UPI003AF20DE9
MDMEGAQEPQGDPERSPSPTMPLTPTRRSHQFLLTSSPTPEEASEWDEEGDMPPRQPSLVWQETWSSEGSDQPAEDSLLEEGYIADEDSILSEDSEGSLDDLLDVERSLPEDTALSEPTNTAQLLEDAGNIWKLCKYSAVEFIRAYVRGTEKARAGAALALLLLGAGGSKVSSCLCSAGAAGKGARGQLAHSIPAEGHGDCRPPQQDRTDSTVWRKGETPACVLQERLLSASQVGHARDRRSALHQDYESHGHHAGGLRTQLSQHQCQHRVGEYLGGLAFAKNFQRILSGHICRPLSTQQLLFSQALLDFALSKDPAVCERAVRRIERLGDFIISYFLSENSDDYEKYKHSYDNSRELYIPILGKLLGHLFIFFSGDESMRHAALDTLFRFLKILKETRESSQTEDMKNYGLLRMISKDSKPPFSIPSTPCEIAKWFGGHLFPDERLDIVLTALEALQDSSTHDKQGACSVLDAALEVPDYWLTDVSGLWPWPCP